MSTTTQPTSVRFGRLERRGVLLGLTGAQLAVAALAVVIATAAVYVGGEVGLALSSLGWGPLLIAATVSVGGRPVVRWVPLLADWATRRATGRTAAVASARAPRRPDTLMLPGIAGRMAVATAPRVGAALVVDRRAGTAVAIARVVGSGFVLADPATQDHRVAGWGRVLAALCQQPAIVRLQVLHRTLPAQPANRTWRQDADPDAPWSSRVLADLLAGVPGERNETLLALAVRIPRGRGRVLGVAQLGEIERHLSALGDSLAAADLRVQSWVGPTDLAATLRDGYDPTTGTSAASAAPGTLQGPMGISEHWDHLRSDGAVHAVYWVAEWPRSDVHPGFLQPLLLAPGTWRAVTLLAEPLPPARALREIRRAKAEHLADAAQRARIGQVEDEATRAEQSDLVRREAELVAGHGDLRFTGLVTVTAPTLDELAAACATTEAAAAQALCEIRRLVGQQGQAHAAGALPLARRLL